MINYNNPINYPDMQTGYISAEQAARVAAPGFSLTLMASRYGLRTLRPWLLLIALLLCGTMAMAQWSATGPSPVWEGSTAKYTFTYAGAVPPGLNLQFSVSGGVLLQSQTNPYNGQPLSATVQWGCGGTTGSITLSNMSPAISASYPVSIWTATNNPAFCTSISPAVQDLVYAQSPERITVMDCSAGCGALYGFSYQWRVAEATMEVIPGQLDWTVVAGATEATYQPPAQMVYGIRAWQRLTTFTTAAGVQTVASATAYTRFRDYLDPGTLSGGRLIAYNEQPAIAHTPATGGQCYGADYSYTWERSVENGPWQAIGTGMAYPAGVPVRGDCAIRRRVQCGSESKCTAPLYFTLLYVSPGAENRNYVRVNEILVPGIQSWPQADQLPTGQKLQTTTYLDGFGRPVQTVTKQGSVVTTSSDVQSASSYQDLVSIQIYDGLGRAARSYLPFGSATHPGLYKPNALAEQAAFTAAATGNAADYNYSYGEVQYDGSPLNRVVSNKPPGAGWLGNTQYNGVRSDYRYNLAAEGIRVWTIGYTSGALPVSTGVYGTAELLQKRYKDNEGKWVVEYEDANGRVVLKKVQDGDTGSGTDTLGLTGLPATAGWLQTYYVYDDFGRLRYTLPPQAVATLATMGLPAGAGWTLTPALAEGLCFYTEYDARGRAVVQHSAGKGEVWAVYDRRDRLVYSQDEWQRAHQPPLWSYALYDGQDRTVATGLVHLTASRAALQQQVYLPGQVNSQPPQSVTVALYTGSMEPVAVYDPVAGTDVQTGQSYCPGATQTLVNTIQYYDSDNTSLPAYEALTTADFAPASLPHAAPLQRTSRTLGMATGGKTRVLDEQHDNGILSDDRFLRHALYYDEQGRLLQSLRDNGMGGVELSATQYDFAGTVLSQRQQHRNGGSMANGWHNLLTIHRPVYDLLRRVYQNQILVTLQPGDIGQLGKYKLLSELRYDALGRVLRKTLGSDANNPAVPNGAAPLETQDYSYNIQGWCTGVNRTYALALYPGTTGYDQWSRRFGYALGYDNSDGSLPAGATPRYDGKLSSMVWRSQGENTPRRYQYRYDNVGRLLRADFAQVNDYDQGATQWGTSRADYSSRVTGYDANGNMSGLQQWGVVPGNNGPALTDDLRYSYQPQSNRLLGVSDAVTAATNGALGDFKNTAGAPAQQYGYGAGGELLYDWNHGVRSATGAGMQYNFLGLPQVVEVKDKSTTRYTYDAGGQRLSQQVVAAATGSSTTTLFVGNMVYRNGQLQYLLTGEGRLRVVQPVAGYTGSSGQVHYRDIRGQVALRDSNWGVWEYWLSDQLGNTRMTLSEQYYEQQWYCQADAPGTAGAAAEEEAAFGSTTGAANEVTAARVATTATPWAGNSSSHVLRLYNGGAAPRAIGPNMLAKVMAGDVVSGRVSYYYSLPAGTTPANTPIMGWLGQSLLGSLDNSMQGVLKTQAARIASVQTVGDGPLAQFMASQPPRSRSPRAFVHYLFFDEQLNFVAKGSGTVAVNAPATGSTTAEGVLTYRAVVPRNGYVYVYLSNESTNIPVYFDNLLVNHRRGAIVEDLSYYPHGLPVATVCGRAAVMDPSRYGYQGAYAEEEGETGYNSFALRQYDPQIGRWVQADPYDVEAGMYNGMGNDPVNAVDEDGGAPEIWGKKQNERGNFEYQWFNGNTVPTGWTAVGNFAADIHCTNGRYATLHDGGRVTWSDHSSQVIQTRYAVADPALFKTPAAPIPPSHYFFDPAPAEGQPVALSSPASQYFFDMRVNRNSWNSQGLFTAITPASMVQRHFAHHPDDIGGGWMYSAAQSAHNFNTAVKEGNWVDAIANGGNFVVALAPPLAYSGMGRGGGGVGSLGTQYSVAFEMKLANSSYPGVYRGAHFLEANKALSATMASDAVFANSMSKLGISIPRSSTGSIIGRSPANWVWHHDINAGVMQLVPKIQHTVGSSFWNTLHPGGRGGFSIWGR